MSTKGIGKIIGYWIAWVLTIWWATVVITNDDVAKQYKENTWKELTIDESELFTFDELAQDTRENKAIFEKYYKTIDCAKYDYDFNASCEDTKTSFKAFIDTFDWEITCYEKLSEDKDLEKYDLINCVDAEKASRDTEETVYTNMYWFCDEDCQADIDAHEYNIALFQSYLNKIN